MSTLTITLYAPKFDRLPGWTAGEVVNLIKTTLDERCDLPGLSVFDVAVDA